MICLEYFKKNWHQVILLDLKTWSVAGVNMLKSHSQRVITARLRSTTGGHVFSLFTPGGMGYPPARDGVPPGQGWGNPWARMGYPQPGLGYPTARIRVTPARTGVPPARDGVPLARGGVPPIQGLGNPTDQYGVPPSQDWGTPRQDWGTPSRARDGYPSPRQVTLAQVMTWAVRLLRFPTGGLFCVSLGLY